MDLLHIFVWLQIYNNLDSEQIKEFLKSQRD